MDVRSRDDCPPLATQYEINMAGMMRSFVMAPSCSLLGTILSATNACQATIGSKRWRWCNTRVLGVVDDCSANAQIHAK
jgi:hypothetical protein